MAITVKNFALLIARIQYVMGDKLMSNHEAECFYDLCQDMQQSAPTAELPKADLIPLFNALCTPGKKIEAIKFHRMLTGFALKESKDEIERLICGVIKANPNLVG